MGQRILLVEGRADSTFYEAFCRVMKRKGIDVKAPTSIGATVDGKTNAIHHLPLLLQQLDDASVSHLGLVVDADYKSEHGLGCAMTLEKVREKMVAHGFRHEKRGNGFTFSHPDGLPAVGLWIMPDNQHDGMLEDFIKSSILSPPQIELHAAACRVVAALREPLFKPIHRSKAEVRTWLAWQNTPGGPLEHAIGNSLIELSSTACQEFNNWLGSVFY